MSGTCNPRHRVALVAAGRQSGHCRDSRAANKGTSRSETGEEFLGRFLEKSRRHKRRGTILILAAIMVIAMMGMLALSGDLGYIMTVRAELKRATDAAALAGAGTLIEGESAARMQSVDFLLRNPVGSQMLLEAENREALLEAWLAQHPD